MYLRPKHRLRLSKGPNVNIGDQNAHTILDNERVYINKDNLLTLVEEFKAAGWAAVERKVCFNPTAQRRVNTLC